MEHDGESRRKPLLIKVWLALSALLPVGVVAAARILHKRQGAAPERFDERLGHAPVSRPAGRLIWVHAASVGEVASVARLARDISAQKNTKILVTTTTVTGSATVARLIPDAMHQLLPLDTPAPVRRFLNHWHPDAALFVEGDLWPRIILSLSTSGCPIALINARASRTRRRFRAAFAALLTPMRLITVQDAALIDEFRSLGMHPARLSAPGNLKADIDLPSVDHGVCARLRDAATDRGIWAAVSTHPGEETDVLDVHAELPGAPLLILVPRHPARAHALAAELARRGFAYTRHSKGETPTPETDIHLVDAMGATGTVYAAAGLAFIGGSLVKGYGGHTPFEPIALGCAVVSGPHVQNFATAFHALQAADAACLVPDKATLVSRITTLLSDKDARQSMQNAALAAHAAHGGASRRTLRTLHAALPDVFAAVPASQDNKTTAFAVSGSPDAEC